MRPLNPMSKEAIDTILLSATVIFLFMAEIKPHLILAALTTLMFLKEWND